MRVRSRLIRRLALAASLLAVAGAHPAGDRVSVVALLDQYSSGQFESVSASLAAMKDFNDLLKQLKQSAPAWLDAGGLQDRPRREVAAATFALEAARAGELEDWKLLQHWMRLDNIYWHAPPQLIEWGCVLLGRTPSPRPIERIWHLAALAVADRAGDFEFLVGSPWEGRANPKDEIKHLEHSAARFPTERRFALAQGIAVEWRLFPNVRPGSAEAQLIFEKLKDDEQVGGEASVRLGLMRLRSGSVGPAIALFDAAEQHTREPFVVYLARYFRGQALERQRRTDDAVQAYRGALFVVPGAQSSSFALSALLAGQGHRAEAAHVVDAALLEEHPVDPWRAYGEADARFWPTLIAELHREIHR